MEYFLPELNRYEENSELRPAHVHLYYRGSLPDCFEQLIRKADLIMQRA